MRLRAWWPSRRAMTFDVVLAAAVALLELGGALIVGAPVPWALWLPVVLAAAVGVVLRRRLPLVTLITALVDTVALNELSAALPIAAYAVTRYESRWAIRVPALGVAFLVALRLWNADMARSPVSAVANASIFVLLPAVLGAYVAARTQLVQALLERAERAEAAQDAMTRQAVLEERTRIAREMHDVVGHRVSLMVLQAGAVEMAAGDRQKVGQLAEQMQTAGRQALAELRQLVGLLRTEEGAEPPLLAPQPTLADLTTLIEESRRAGMEVTFETAGQPRRVDEATSRAAYRVVQEALTNAGRHAPGAGVQVTLTYRPTELSVLLVNRRATRVSEAVLGGGLGLVGLRERTQVLGGELRAGPRLDGGFGVEAVFPT